jgi:hypothetical protein
VVSTNKVRFTIDPSTNNIIANKEVKLDALPSFVTEDNPKRFQAISSEDYIRRSLQLAYSKPDVNREIGTIEIKG